MFSFFAAQPITGIALTASTVQAAQAQQKNGTLTLLHHAEKGIESGAGEGNPASEKITAALQSLTSTGMLSYKRSVVLLSAELVYTQLFAFPVASKNNLRASVNDAVARTIPEEFADLNVHYKILGDSKDQIVVGVAAIRRDVLDTYREATTKAKVSSLAFSTAPCAIVAAYHSPKKPTSFLLVTVCGGQMIVTLFHYQWPIDEVILTPDSSIEAIVKTGMEMAAEYRERGVLVDTVLLADTLERATLPTVPSLTLETVFPTFKDRSWLPVACASALDPRELSVNLLA